jgi:hypothetical protein
LACKILIGRHNVLPPSCGGNDEAFKVTHRKHLKLGNMVTGRHPYLVRMAPSQSGTRSQHQFQIPQNALILERGKFDFAFIADSVSINERSRRLKMTRPNLEL